MQIKHRITSTEELEQLYGTPSGAALDKEVTQLTPEYRKWIEAAPFMAMASSSADKIDCSPRGDGQGELLKVLDAHTIVIPDRAGNKRLDTMGNLLSDPRISLLFLIPGIIETLRITGKAVISTDPDLIDLFETGGKPPVTVMVVQISSVFFQCGRSILRSRIWEPEARSDPASIPSAGDMLRGAKPGFDAKAYDAALPGRQKESL